MSQSCCLRSTLVTLNVAFFLIGGVALGTGVWLFVEHNELINYLDKQTSDMERLMTSVVCQLIVLGVTAIVVAICGFCQSGTQSSRLFRICSAVVLPMMASASILGWILLYSFNMVTTDLYAHMQQLLQNKYSSHLSVHGAGGAYKYSYENEETLAADLVQLKLGCCGAINGSDYFNATMWNRTVSGSNATMIIPVTCCQMSGGAEILGVLKRGTSGNLTPINITCPFTSHDSNINTGCYSAVNDILKMISALIKSIGYSTIEVQMLMCVIAVFLYQSDFKDKVMP